MNTKIVVSGAAALALLLGGYAYHDPIAKTVTGLFKGKQTTATNSDTGGRSGRSSRGRRGRSGRTEPVTLATVVQRAAPEKLLAIGTVQPVATVAVKARVDGQLDQAFFQEGQPVTKGQKLFRLDPRPFEVALRQAQANLARDRAQLEKTKSDFARYGQLLTKGYTSQQQFETVKANNAAQEAIVRADQAAVEAARLQLDYTTIYAPIDGRTGNLLVSVGNLVKANDSNPLVTITQMKPIYVAFSVPERHLGEIRALMAGGTPVPVEVHLAGDTSHVHTGTLSFINNTVDAATGTIQLKATFPNANESLTPGAFVNVALTVKERPDAIVIPSPAVQVGQKGNFVFVAKSNNTVEMRPITIEDSNENFTVVKSGLKPGEKVVTDGQLQLVPGSHIRPRTSGATGGNGNDGAVSAPATAKTARVSSGSGKHRKHKGRGDGT